MGECSGHGELQADGCECDRLYYGDECEHSFRNATGAALSVAQSMAVIPYVILLWSAAQQLRIVYPARDHKLLVQLLLVVSCSTFVVWMFDPYGMGGHLSVEAALVLIAVATLSMLMASTTTVIHWRQLLHSSRLSNVLEGRYLYVTLALWVITLTAAGVLMVHYLVTGNRTAMDLLNVILILILASQTVVLVSAAFKLRKVVSRLGASRVAKLANLAHMFSLLGVAGGAMSVALIAFTALGLDDDPWAWFFVVMVLGRAVTLVILLVLYAATAGTLVPTAHKVMRVILRVLCLWLPSSRRTVLPSSSPSSRRERRARGLAPAPAAAAAPAAPAAPAPAAAALKVRLPILMSTTLSSLPLLPQLHHVLPGEPTASQTDSRRASP